MKGRIFDIQRFSIHDGPGIRTAVFLKGCPMDCLWCHNPEGIAAGKDILFSPEKCIGCGYCLRVCGHKAHKLIDGRHVLDRSLCKSCGACARECYSGAIEAAGREVEVGEVINVVMRDRPFYDTTGGGMTLSGGEPLAQADFCEALLREAGARGLHRCVETSGYADFTVIERMRGLTDLFLYDIKDSDDKRHRQLTGVSNGPILDNLKRLHALGARIVLRLPLIPGQNVRDGHFEAVAALVKSLPGLCGVEMLPYHRLGVSKLRRTARQDRALEFEAPDAATVRSWRERFAALGVTVSGGE